MIIFYFIFFLCHREAPVYSDNTNSDADTIISAKCSEIPSALNVTFLVANVRTQPIGELQMEIVGARIRYICMYL